MADPALNLDGYSLYPVEHDPFAVGMDNATSLTRRANAAARNYQQGDPAGVVAPAQMQSYTPTFSQRAGDYARDLFTKFGAPRSYAESFGAGVGNLTSMTPMSAGYDAGRAAAGGDYVGAAVNALGALPDGGALLHAGSAGLAGLAPHAIFAGPLARTADLEALSKAKSLARKGADRDAIWGDTGWFQGVDKKWRYEIPDDQARFALQRTGVNQSGQVGGMIEHPELYDAYPNIAKIKSGYGRMEGSSGAYGANKSGQEMLVVSDTYPDPRDVSLHELQHAVQAREGFARGGNPASPEVVKEANARKVRATDFYEKSLEHLRMYQDKMAAERGITRDSPDYHKQMVDLAREWREVYPHFAEAKDNAVRAMNAPPNVNQVYNDLAGEVEARNVQTRRDMTPEERRATPPWMTQDVPSDQQVINKKPSIALSLPPEEKPPGFTAYHGSPHQFDRFDLSKIGTGEGAQAYGHGLYFADNENVAKSYRDDLALQNVIGKNASENIALNAYSPRIGLDNAIKDVSSLMSAYDKRKMWSSSNKREDYEQALNILNGWKQKGLPGQGHMYEARINADPEHFLDWDKPLSEQHPKVKEAFSRLGVDTPDKTRHWMNSASNVYAAKTNTWETAAGARGLTQALAKEGVPGVKYLDQGSRTAGDGSRNYVVFDDKLIDILRRYGIGGAAAGGLGYSLMPVDGDPFAQQPQTF